jgi:hypothetical protein
LKRAGNLGNWQYFRRLQNIWFQNFFFSLTTKVFKVLYLLAIKVVLAKKNFIGQFNVSVYFDMKNEVPWTD